MIYDIHKARWVYFLIWVGLLVQILLVVFLPDPIERLIVGVVLLVDLPLLLFVLAVFHRGYHMIEGKTLTVYYGFVKWVIPLDQVKSARVVQKKWYSNIWPPAFKTRQVELTYGIYGKLEITAPDKEDEFIKAVLKHHRNQTASM
ncbi:hypothetical protein CR205_04215 [Alteribacter lacisalsi]|uniref:Uncharacterized protein YyaB-like PH domain-containing protein n=1 Tax=Alteribacter lacisalsi TaxID=2045244 RepID=A0A2W0HAH5_9BACI|nr:PH domain-containing protein [Alteribacter lacisalsi]PYZ97806.1 hypothetical protein CR205_04215 [Alteribacter lacisalsi]